MASNNGHIDVLRLLVEVGGPQQLEEKVQIGLGLVRRSVGIDSEARDMQMSTHCSAVASKAISM